MSKFHELKVTDVRRETRDTVSIAFEVPEELKDTYRYEQGQHVAVRTWIDGQEVMRTYSVCTGVQDDELRVAVKKQPYGRFSTFANRELRIGDVLEVMPPMGHFNTPLDPDAAKGYIAFAAGSGITPIMSIMKTTLATEPKSRFTLVYGNRNTGSVIFREQLEDLKNQYMERLNLIHVMSREEPDIPLFHGHINEETCAALFKYWLDPGELDEAFICGPEPMIQAVRESLEAHGFDRKQIHFELFTAPGESQKRHRERLQDPDADRSLSTVEVYQDGRKTEFELPRNTETILDAGIEAGADLPFSCKGGVCSTCRAKVVEGEVDMDVNYALEDYEIEAGYVLTCQSFPISDKVVLDYDQ